MVAGLKSGHYKRKSTARNRCATKNKIKQILHPVQKANGVRNDRQVMKARYAETLKLAPDAAEGAPEGEEELLSVNCWKSCCMVE